MEAIVAEAPKDGQQPRTPTQAIAQVLQKFIFLQNVGIRDAALKRNAKAATMNARVQELQNELHAEKERSVELRVKLDIL